MGDSSERVLSLFAGIGGLDLGVARGLRAVGRDHRAVAYVEGEAFGVACLAAQMRAGRLAPAPVWSDVRTFGAAVCPGPVDGIIGGFPCQDISSAGKRAGIEGEKSGLFFEIARLVREMGPRWVFLENVRGITVRGLDTVLGTLADLGLDAEWTCIRASDVGAPHKRERWFCLGYSQGSIRDTETGWISLPRAAFSGAGESLADAAGLVRERRESGRGRRWESKAADRNGCRDVAYRDGLRGGQEQQSTQRWRRDADEYGKELADADINGQQGQRLRPDDEQRDADRSSCAWPPGPDDAEGWRRYLEAWPGLEPAVCRGANGIPARLDRLRALGNAVVPAQAEAAFTELWRRAGL